MTNTTGVVKSVSSWDAASPERDGHAERNAQLRAHSGPERERKRTARRGERRHQDRPEAEHRRAADRHLGGHTLAVLTIDREVDHHDRVLRHDADEQNDPDQRDDVQLEVKAIERDERSDGGGRERGEDRQRMDEALVEHPEQQVDDDERREDQQRLLRGRGLERLRGACERAADRGRKTDALLRALHDPDC